MSCFFATHPGTALAMAMEQLDAALFGSQPVEGSSKRQRQDPALQDEDEDLITRILGRQIPQKLLKDIKLVVKKFSDLIGKLSRATSRKVKATKDLAELKASRYPAGVRPYQPSSEAGLLEPLDLAADEDFKLEITIPKGSTRKEAVAKVHLAAATFYKHVEVETTTAFVETLKKQTDYQVFLAEACAPATRHHLAVQSLGINLPPGLEAPVQVSKQKAMELYIGMVNRLALEKTKKEALDEKEKNQREKLKEEVRNANPRDLFDQAVRQVLQETPSSSMRSQVDYVKAVAESKEDCIRDKAPVLQHQPKGAGRGRGKPADKDQNKTRRFTKTELAARKVRAQHPPQQQEVPKNDQSQGSRPGDKKGKGKGKQENQVGKATPNPRDGSTKSGKGSKSGKGTKNQGKGNYPGKKGW